MLRDEGIQFQVCKNSYGIQFHVCKIPNGIFAHMKLNVLVTKYPESVYL